MGRLIDADKIIFREVDEIGGDYEPYLGCSKSQINSLPTVEAIPKDQYEARLKADMVAMLEDLRFDFQEAELVGVFDNKELIFADEVDELVQQKINALKENSHDD